MVFCGISQIMIAVVILLELNMPIIYNVEFHVTFVRFFCLSAIHFGLANEFKVSLYALKYLAYHMDNFKYPTRAFLACQIAIIAVLLTEILSIKYIMVQDDTLAVFNNFIKMKILSMFDNFFLEAYQHSSMARFIGININIDKFRKDKIYLPRKLLVD